MEYIPYQAHIKVSWGWFGVVTTFPSTNRDVVGFNPSEINCHTFEHS